MRILALEPYYGGSHRAFLDGWFQHSRHDWSLLTAPPHKWKWRMRHAALTFADALRSPTDAPPPCDAVFASDMLDLATWKGLAPLPYTTRPAVLYMHENQFTYPQRRRDPRDAHYGYTNFTAALAADVVWWNSAWHRDTCLDEMERTLSRMPDFPHADRVSVIRAKSTVQPPGIHPMPARPVREPAPLRILWAARWEHDKNPEDFFSAIEMLEDSGVPYELLVAGEHFATVPPVFETARAAFAHRIGHWGYAESRAAYERLLLTADVFVSTATHEFFGISLMEARAAGCRVLAPDRLAYPEVLGGHRDSLYDGTVEGLAERLRMLAIEAQSWEVAPEDGDVEARVEDVARFLWSVRADAMDNELERLVTDHPA